MIGFLDVNETQSKLNLFTFDNNVTPTGIHGKSNLLTFIWWGRCKERILLVSLVNLAGHQASPHIGVGGVAFVAKDPFVAHVDGIGIGFAFRCWKILPGSSMLSRNYT